MKIIKAIILLLMIICFIVWIIAIGDQNSGFMKPAAIGAIFFLYGLLGLMSDRVATRVSLIFKKDNKIFYYLMIATYFLFSAYFFKWSFELWQKQ